MLPSAFRLLAALGLFATGSVQAGWQLAWSDEFDGTEVDPAKWTFDIGNGTGGWGNNELEYYTSRTNNVYVADSLLHIVALNEVPQYNGFDYSSARLKTLGLFSKKYGRFEFRARLPQGQGYWPALWMLSQDSVYGGWAASGEIDVMENRGSEPTITAGTIHYGGSWPDNVYSGASYVFPGGGVATDFHDYRLDWETNSLKWYVDGVLYQTQTNWYSTGGSYPAPFDQPFYLIMNLAVGGNYGGDPDGTTVFPGEMQVDYVRVYEYTPSAPEAPTGLTAHAGNGQVFLGWDAPIGATGYHVKRASNSGGPYTAIASPATASYTDTDVSTCSSYYYVVSATNSLGESTESSEAAVTLGVFTVAVNSGGSAAAQFGADSGFSGGTQAAPTTTVIDTSGVVAPAPQAVYQTERYGNFTYTFTDLTAGLNYKVRLHFAEYYFSAVGQRVFNVFTNGTQALDHFDIVAAAGARNKATVREFTIAANGSGQIVIGYSNVVDNAKSSGIEIVIPRTAAPVNLTAMAANAQVALQWSPSTEAASYNVKRSAVSGGPYTPVSTGLTGNGYTDTGLTNGTTYYYVVSAVNAGCESVNSTQVSATPQLGWGNALSFDGVNDFLVVSNFGSLVPTSEVTVEFWQRLAVNNKVQTVFRLDPDNGANRFMFDLRDNGSLIWDFGNLSTGGRLISVPSLTAAGSWQHFAAVAKVGTTHSMAIYRNGQLVASTNTADLFAPDIYDLILGHRKGTYDYYLQGELDEFRIWNKARSQAEIQATMLRPLSGSEPNLVAYWKFDEPAGATTLLDSTTNHYEAHLINGTAEVVSSVTGPNLVVNPGFEQGSGGWYGFGGAGLSATTSQRHSGTYSVEVSQRNYTWAGVAQQFKNVLRSGHLYQVSAWVRLLNSASAPVGLTFVKVDGSGTSYSLVALVQASSNSWTQLRGSFALNVTGQLSDLQLYMDGPPPGVVFFADDFAVTEDVLAAPGVTTLAAGDLSAVGAVGQGTLLGSVTPNGLPTTHWFEWGTNSPYGQMTSPGGVGDGWGAVSTCSALTGLTPGVIYHYRLVASNSVGLTLGADQMFWLPALNLNGPSLLTHECHVPFDDPTTAAGVPPAIAAGETHSLALRADSTVVGWGDNLFGQATSPVSATNVVGIAAGPDYNLALRGDGTVVGWGANSFGQATGNPMLVSTGLVTIAGQVLSNVVAVAAGGNGFWGHSLALRADGTVVGWGNNESGQATGPASATNVVAIAAGGVDAGGGLSLALRADGTVIGWGRNNYGQATGNPTGGSTTGLVTIAGQVLNNVVAIAGGESHSLALRADGTVVGWGYNNYGQATGPASATNVVAIAAGSSHNLALRADGTAIGWGRNNYGQAIGIPTSGGTTGLVTIAGQVLNNVVAIAAGEFHSLALRADGTIVGWGADYNGQATPPAGLNTLHLPFAVSGAVDVDTPGIYTLTYSATNTFGAVATATRTVIVVAPPQITGMETLGDGTFRLRFTSTPGAPFTVLATTNVALPSGDWTILGLAAEDPPGEFQFTDPAANSQPARYYRLVLPVP